MKRLLVIFMMLSAIVCQTYVLAAETDNTKNSTKNENAISLMTILGIIGDTDEEMLTETVNRGDFAAYLCAMLQYDKTDDLFAGEKPYADVDIWHAAAGSIYYLKQMGIIDGTDDGVFLPDEPVTFGAACKLLIAAAGYPKEYIQQFGEYPTGNIKVAADLGITDGVSLTAEDELPLGSAVRMLYNLLDVRYGQIKTVTGYGTVEYDYGEVFSEAVMSLYKFRGTMTADNFISLYGETVGINQAVINGELYETENYYTDYIGMAVEGYAYDPDGSNKRIVWMAPYASSRSVVLYDENIDSYENGKYYYYSADNMNRKLNISIPKDTPIIYNYAQTGRTDVMVPADGEVKIIYDNHGVSAVIIKEYKTYFITSIDSYNKEVRTSSEEKLDLSDSDIEFQTPSGKPASFESIVKNSVISLVSNDVESGRTLCIISNSYEDGTVRSISEDDWGNPVITTDTGEYIIQTTSPEIENYRGYMRSHLRIYLDHEGKLFYAEAVRDSSEEPIYRYGYLIKAVLDDSGETAILKLLDQDGTIYKYNIEKSVKVDESKLSPEILCRTLSLDFDAGVTARQAIRYRIIDGKIIEIQTGQKYTEGTTVEDKLLIRANAKRYYYKPNGTFKRLLPVGTEDRLTPEIIMAKNPVAFMVPPETAVSRSFDDSAFKVVTLSSIMSEDKACWIKAYNTNSEWLENDLIVYFYEDSFVFDKTIPYIMVTDIEELYNEEIEEVVTRVSGIGNNTSYTYDANDMDFFKPNGYKIKPGDMIRVIKSEIDGLAKALELVYTPDYDGSIMGADRSWYPTRTGVERNVGYSLIYGTIEKINGGSMVVTYGDRGEITDREYFPVSSIPIYIYDADRKKEDCVYRGTYSELEPGMRVCVVNNWAQPKYMFAYLRD